MDDKLNALDKLIEAVEAGTLGVDDYPDEWTGLARVDLLFDAYHGSLDAALALHEALLPGWAPVIDLVANEIGMHRQCHDDDGCPTDEWEWCFEVRGHTPARAWLLAILRAYRSVRA